MSSVLTTYLPLTTTFTAPAECWDTPWMYQGVPTTWWKQGGDNVPSCFPPAYPFSNSRIIYSPGICPAGWTSACDRTITTRGSTQNVVSCCPASFECASTSRDVHDWEDQFGCASPYSINTDAWELSSGAAFVSSMYQLQVMIVEAMTTSGPSDSIASSTSPSPASSAESTSAPTANPTNTQESPSTNNSGLSKGATAGVAIGAVVGIAVIALLAYIAWVVHKKHRAATAGSLPMAQQPEDMHYAAPYYYNPQPTEMDAGAPPRLYELKTT